MNDSNTFKWSNYVYLILVCLGATLFISGAIIISTLIVPSYLYNYPRSLEGEIPLALPKGRAVLKPVSTLAPLCIYLDASLNHTMYTEITLEDKVCADWDDLRNAIADKISALNSNETVPIQIYAEDKVPIQAIVTTVDTVMEFRDRTTLLLNDFIGFPKANWPKPTEPESPPVAHTGVIHHILNSGIIGYIIIGLGIMVIILGVRALHRGIVNVGYWGVNAPLLLGILAVALSLLGVFTCLMSMFGHIKAKMNPDESIMLGYLSRLFVIAFEGFAVAAVAFGLYWYLLRRGTSCHRGTESTENAMKE